MKKLSLYKTQWYALGGIALTLFIGSAVIIYQGRPAYDMQQAENNAEQNSDVEQDSTQTETQFSFEQVQAHSTPEDCWAAINGSVYDLSTWVSRHPGGATPIEGLCGTDGSEKFTRVHGKSNVAQAALVLLKIGELE